MSDATIRSFCSYGCVIAFQSKFPSSSSTAQKTPPGLNNKSVMQAEASKVTPVVKLSGSTPRTTIVGTPQSSMTPRLTPVVGQQTPVLAPKMAGQKLLEFVTPKSETPVISNVMSLAQPAILRKPTVPSQSIGIRLPPPLQPRPTPTLTKQAVPPSTPTAVSVSSVKGQQTAEIPTSTAMPVVMRNKAVLCRPYTQSKGVQMDEAKKVSKGTNCRPMRENKDCQTDVYGGAILVPFPLLVPVPVQMFTQPVPVPLPIPVPLPFPCFLPTGKGSMKEIMKKMKQIQEKYPEDPIQAELLLMAEQVERDSNIRSDSPDEDDGGDVGGCPPSDDNNAESPTPMEEDRMTEESRGSPAHRAENGLRHLSNGETEESSKEAEPMSQGTVVSWQVGETLPRWPRVKEEPGGDEDEGDVAKNNMKSKYLKFWYGVNAWTRWVVSKNSTIQSISKGSGRLKQFKTDLLQLSPDELNYSLCLFVKEAKRPNGEAYSPDSIYLLCLGIQRFLSENGRVDNIFSDFTFEKFTEGLHEILTKHRVVVSPKGMVLGRVNEEMLWECEMLGAHSPFTLLNTLLYFNTYYFLLNTAEEHIGLKFSSITKQWNRSFTDQRVSCSLKYLPPAGSTKEVLVHQGVSLVQNESANELRCPIRLYEFYLNRCPESSRGGDNPFYLFPERSCVPESPVWFSNQAVPSDTIMKMLTRVKAVTNVNQVLIEMGIAP